MVVTSSHCHTLVTSKTSSAALQSIIRPTPKHHPPEVKVSSAQKQLASIFTNAHHCPWEIYVFKTVVHSCCGLEAVLFIVASTYAYLMGNGWTLRWFNLITENLCEFLLQFRSIVAASAAKDDVPGRVDNKGCRETRYVVSACHICWVVQKLAGMCPIHVVIANEFL